VNAVPFEVLKGTLAYDIQLQLMCMLISAPFIQFVVGAYAALAIYFPTFTIKPAENSMRVYRRIQTYEDSILGFQL
jgi:hypothetical protein